MGRGTSGSFRPWMLAIAVICLLATSPAARGAEEDEEEETLIKGRPIAHWITRLGSSNRGLQARASRNLLPLLKASRENTRAWAAQVLGNYGPISRAAVPDLVPMLKGTQYERNRAAAARALGQILENAKPCKEVDAAAKALSAKYNEDYDQYSDVRREAVHAVGMIGPAAKSVIPKMTRALTDWKKYSAEHAMVRQQAAWAAGRMGPLAAEHIDRLLATLKQEGEKLPEIVWAIGEIGPVHENVAPNIVDKLEMSTKYENFVLEALKALAKFKEKAAPGVEFLIAYLKERNPSPECLAETFRTLQAIGPKAAKAKALVGKYKDIKSYRPPHRRPASEEQVAAIRKAAVECLGVIGK